MIIRIHSHRARRNLKRVLGRLPQGYYSFHQKGEWREVTDQEFEQVKAIKGITKSKLPEKAMECWEMEKSQMRNILSQNI